MDLIKAFDVYQFIFRLTSSWYLIGYNFGNEFLLHYLIKASYFQTYLVAPHKSCACYISMMN
jgi:hypothetical protein